MRYTSWVKICKFEMKCMSPMDKKTKGIHSNIEKTMRTLTIELKFWIDLFFLSETKM